MPRTFPSAGAIFGSIPQKKTPSKDTRRAASRPRRVTPSRVALAAPEIQLEQLLEALPDGIVLVNQAGLIVYANTLMEQLSGSSSSELVGQPIEVLVPKDVRRRHERHRADYAVNRRARPMGVNLEISMQRKDGTVFPADIALSPLSREPEILVVASVRDATERRRAQSRLQAVIDVTRLLMEGESERALQQIAHYARVLAGAELAIVMEPSPDDSMMRVTAADGERATALQGTALPLTGSLAGEAMRTGRSINVADARSDPRAHRPTVEAGQFGPVFCVPLRAGGRSFGVLEVVNRPGAAPFWGESLTVVELFGSQAAVALEYARLRQELERLAVLEDRERIAKDLHDGVIQELFAVGMTLQATEAKADDPEAVRSRLDDAVDGIDAAIRDLRNYIFGLRPGLLADRQLAAALRQLVLEFEERTGIVTAVEIDARVAAHFASAAAGLVQVVREALSNVARHAKASTVRLTLVERDGRALLEIDDDGQGLDGDQPRATGQGLRNMRERAEAMGGEFLLESFPQQGTLVRITLPL